MGPRTRSPMVQPNTIRSDMPDRTATKTRRSHKKSRSGCTSCKERHIRCDETRPTCAHCQTAGRTCSYPTVRTSKKRQKQRNGSGAESDQHRERQATAVSSPGSAATGLDSGRRTRSPSQSHQQASSPGPENQPDQTTQPMVPRGYLLTPVATNDNSHSPNPPLYPITGQALQVDRYPGLPALPDPQSRTVFTADHLVLLHHAYSVPNYIGPNRNAIDITLRHANDAPYLLDEVLAFTAFHMATLYPGSAEYLQILAAELQTRALESFTRLTRELPHDDETTAVPRFLFSGILGRHVLADSLTYCTTNFHEFVARFTTGINLNRGIRAVCPPAWGFLYGSEMRPFLDVIRKAESRIARPGDECSPLSTMMDASDLNDLAIKCCRNAIVILQWAFDICRELDVNEFPQAASAFHVRIEPGYLDALRKHHPEALVILAYYGVLLHRCRNFRAFGGAGAPLIRAIAGQLSDYWQESLMWPLQQSDTEQQS